MNLIAWFRAAETMDEGSQKMKSWVYEKSSPHSLDSWHSGTTAAVEWRKPGKVSWTKVC